MPKRVTGQIEDWKRIDDPQERRRVQNRESQRRFRDRKKNAGLVHSDLPPVMTKSPDYGEPRPDCADPDYLSAGTNTLHLQEGDMTQSSDNPMLQNLLSSSPFENFSSPTTEPYLTYSMEPMTAFANDDIDMGEEFLSTEFLDNAFNSLAPAELSLQLQDNIDPEDSRSAPQHDPKPRQQEITDQQRAEFCVKVNEAIGQGVRFLALFNQVLSQ